MTETAKRAAHSALTIFEKRVDDAQQFMAEQGRANAWMSLPGTRSVGFMDLRGCNCRWPVNDLKHDGAVRYCGATCAPEASYCVSHQQIAFAPSKRR